MDRSSPAFPAPCPHFMLLTHQRLLPSGWGARGSRKEATRLAFCEQGLCDKQDSWKLCYITSCSQSARGPEGREMSHSLESGSAPSQP